VIFVFQSYDFFGEIIVAARVPRARSQRARGPAGAVPAGAGSRGRGPSPPSLWPRRPVALSLGQHDLAADAPVD
jgi:hypothetical protein